MFKIFKYIIFGIFIILSLTELLISLDIISIIYKDFYTLNLIYVIISLLTFFILLLTKKNKKSETVYIYTKKEEKKEEEQTKNVVDKSKYNVLIEQVINDVSKHTSSIEEFSEHLFKSLSKNFKIVQGYFYLWDENEKIYKTVNTYAFYDENINKIYELGEGIVGQVAKNKKPLVFDNIPENYIKVVSGLGKGTPKYLSIVPIIDDNKTIAIIEFANFEIYSEEPQKTLEKLSVSLTPYLRKIVK